jgi:hypothetical protein
MKPNAQVVSLRMSVFFGAVLLVAFVIFPGFFPPISPQWSATHVAEFYARHTTMIRASMVTFNFCGVMLVPFLMVIVYQMKRMSAESQVFAYSYLSAAATGVTLFALADLFWLIAAFRPERDPQLILLLNDLAWITFTAPVGMIVVQNLCLAAAVYLDRNPEPIFPRWVAPFSLIVAVAIAPSAGAAVFRTGPLAWNGAVSFWLRNAAYATYLVVMFFVLRAAIRREALEEGGAPATELVEPALP